jgi:hydrogenase maturation protease
MTERPARILVIGLGNPLMGDDGAGLAALERLRDEWEISPDVELVDGGTWGMNLLPMIEMADAVLLLDAIANNREPGTLIELVGEEVPRGLEHKLSPHQIDLREVLALAMLRGTLPPQLAAIGVEPAVVAMGTTLSAPVAAAIPAMLARTACWLEALGCRCAPRAPLECTS